MFKIYGFDNVEIVGRTPFIYDIKEHVPARKFSQSDYPTRGYEIKHWLKEHPKVLTYVILDDSSDMLESQEDNFVRTNFEIGLSEQDADKAILILNDDPCS